MPSMPTKSAACNRYNVRRLRKELDDCIRSYSWKTFRSTLRSIAPCDVGAEDGTDNASGDENTDKELIRAVTLERPRSAKGVPLAYPTLLHTLLNKVNSGSCTVQGGRGRMSQPPPYDVVELIASNVPEALLVQDGKTGRTPLHLAVVRDACPYVVEALIGHDKTGKSLSMMDSGGDTPLLARIRKGGDIDFADDAITNMLIRYDKGGRTLLIPSKKKQAVPLFLIAAKELRYAGLLQKTFGDRFDHDTRLPDAIRMILVKTQDALEKSRREVGGAMQAQTEPEAYALHTDVEDIHQDTDDVEISTGTALHAATACSHLLFELRHLIFTVLVFEAESQEGDDVNGRFLSFLDRRNSNTLLHSLCFCEGGLPLITDDWKSSSSGVAFRPLSFHEFVITRYPDMLKVPNSEGDLPLHFCVKQGPQFLVDSILNAYPEAVRHRNKRGEIPLHTALKSVLSNKITKMKYLDIAESIWRAWPESLQERDLGTLLFPFQIPAIAETNDNLDEKQCLSASFLFLTKMPELCESGIQ